MSTGPPAQDLTISTGPPAQDLTMSTGVLNYLVFQCFGFERIDLMKVIPETWALN
jgi:hypothetical protein